MSEELTEEITEGEVIDAGFVDEEQPSTDEELDDCEAGHDDEEIIGTDEATLNNKILEFELSDEEIVERARTVCAVRAKIAEANDELASIKKTYKGKLTALDEEMSDLLNVIEEGKEEREVECIFRKDFVTSQGHYIVDGKIHSSRPLKDAERQLSLLTPEAYNESRETETDRDVKGIMNEETNRATATDMSNNAS